MSCCYMCVRVYCIAVVRVVCFFSVFFTFVAYCLPDNLYCVGGAVKPCSLTQSVHWWYLLVCCYNGWQLQVCCEECIIGTPTVRLWTLISSESVSLSPVLYWLPGTFSSTAHWHSGNLWVCIIILGSLKTNRMCIFLDIQIWKYLTRLIILIGLLAILTYRLIQGHCLTVHVWFPVSC